MRVKVRPINVNGKPLFTKERDRRDPFTGDLKVAEIRMPSLGRTVISATVLDVLEGIETPLLEMNDIALLWVNKTQMRIRGFEIQQDVQYSQTWDVEIL